MNALQLPSLSLGSELISPVPRTVSAKNVSVLDTLSTLVRAIPSVGVVLLAGKGVLEPRTDSALARLAARRVPENRIIVQRTDGARLAAGIDVR